MDVAKASDINSVRVSGAAFDRVLTIGSDGKMHPWIATSWTNPDPRTFVFKIRQGVKFWDGKPLTTGDVAFSLRRHLDKKLASTVAGNIASVKSVTATAGQHRHGEAEDAGRKLRLSRGPRLARDAGGLRQGSRRRPRHAEEARDGYRSVHDDEVLGERGSHASSGSPATGARSPRSERSSSR